MKEKAPVPTILEIVAYFPGGRTLRVVAPNILEWNPTLPALCFRDEDARMHQLHGCGFEVILEESRIARVA